MDTFLKTSLKILEDFFENTGGISKEILGAISGVFPEGVLREIPSHNLKYILKDNSVGNPEKSWLNILICLKREPWRTF